MIPKCNSGSNYYGLLTYLETKDNKEEQPQTTRIFGEFPNMISNVIYSNRMDIALAFEDWDKKNNNINFKKKVAHFSLSFSPKDVLNENQLKEISKTFLSKMGYEHIPYVIYKHSDKFHPHIHIVTSRVGVNGKKVKHDYEAKDAIKICREIEKEFRLTPVTNKKIHTSSLLDFPADNLISYNPTERHLRETVLHNLRYALNHKRVTTIEEINHIFKGTGIQLFTVDAKGKSLPRNGYRFYYINEKGKLVSYIKGRDISKKLSEKLNAKFNQNNYSNSYKQKLNLPKYLYEQLKSYNENFILSKEDFTQNLKKENIQYHSTFHSDGSFKTIVFEQLKHQTKASDLFYKNHRLDASVFSKYVSETTEKKSVLNKLSNLLIEESSLSGNSLSLKSIYQIAARHHIQFFENNNEIHLLNHDKHLCTLTKQEYNDFLKQSNYNGKNDLSFDDIEKINKKEFICEPLNLEQRFLYDALKNNHPKELREISKSQTHIALTDQEYQRFGQASEKLYQYNRIHNKMFRAKTQLEYFKENNETIPGLKDTVHCLQLRGLILEPEFKKDENGVRQLKNIFFSLAENPDTKLNFFETIHYFSADQFKKIYEAAPMNDKEEFHSLLLLGNEPAYEKPILEHINEIETLQQAPNEELLEEAQLSSEDIDYFKSFEKNEQPYIDEPKFHHKGIRLYFINHGILKNRGEEDAKKSKARFYKSRKKYFRPNKLS